MSNTLRAVGYCRTSSESQRDNTSISNQKDAIERFAAVNGWGFVRYYVDESKSGSKIEGREQFQRMMKDAALGKFDLVVVFDLKRFGRDGMDILDSSRTLAREFNVHVVDTKGTFDTRDRRRTLTNFIHAGVAEDERISILERTKMGKVAVARDHNAPIGPPRVRPFGRIWVRTGKKAGEGHWEIDPVKQAMMVDVATRYVAGESTEVLAKEYCVDRVNLHRTLTNHCGPVWVQHVRCKELGIDETIPTMVPPLLDENTIRDVLARAESNTTYHHGKYRHDYLLSRVVFCGVCGSAMSGQTHMKTGRTYYRHVRSRLAAGCPDQYVPGDDLEETTLHLLFETFGNPFAVQRALEAAIPDAGRASDTRKQLKQAESELDKVKGNIGRLVDAIAEGVVIPADGAPKMKKYKESEGAWAERVEKLRSALGDMPTKEQVRATAERVAGAFNKGRLWAAEHADPSEMPSKERRKLDTSRQRRK